MPKCNSQWRCSPDARLCLQQAGAEQGGMGCIAWGKDWAWMSWGQSEGANVRQQPKLWDSQREGKKRKRERTFLQKNSNLRHCWPAHRTKDWANIRELAGSRPAHPSLEAGRQAGNSQSQKAMGNLGPRDGILYQTVSRLPVANQDVPGFWIVDIWRVAVRDQLPRDTAHLRLCSHCAPRKPRSRDRRGKTHRPPGECVLAKHLVAWAAQTWEGHKTQAQLSLCLCGVPENLNLSSLDLGNACNPGPALDSSLASNLEPQQCRPGKHTCHEQGQTQCGPDTASTPHTCHYLFAELFPPHSTTEQVSLNKWPPLPPCVRVELDTEETCKQKPK